MAFTYSGKLYRAINPIFARDPLSGGGAKKYGGRFNPKGVSALYTSTSILTALRESNQVGDLQPTTLVCYRAEIEMVFDASDKETLAAVGLEEASLSDPTWRDQMIKMGEAHTQRFARTLIEQGYNGVLVRSFAKAASPSDKNLVLWKWSASGPTCVELIDD